MTAKNASGDTFEIFWLGDHWCAEQVTGRTKNWLSIPAYLTDRSRRRLMADLKQHWSNE